MSTQTTNASTVMSNTPAVEIEEIAPNSRVAKKISATQWVPL